ncbi:glycosyltransferase family 1 protein [Mesorhizobium abyssinicae]|uniref:glycosyltransferase family 4 protein n=2 Tax=Phyllobacteriaceae TaxID=69277 RepID=UPI000FD4A659|nr:MULTISPECIES: glycosyltransferase family 1 protein [Mesorhizobium]RVC64534.1 glycosyltransferase family 1 protein [Mesorhizobium sp. M4B.F.Ca.ET.088.02.2.1]MDX8436157.1 glycosyltransferase family 1 protein [Mesorhizobium abyssinicae]RWF26876.1 MAG: glycosyltransferase family 1 protein [Mesorhizobium sp.]TIX17956.1 MAG: glycosyltransferase family 4 protein [Mesorhizobium sp.]TJW01925.1 MAG: glycosyltransferase family 4 protein [Mesorhizobium sp.]
MKIGVDGRNLGSATDGIGRFVHRSVKALSALGAEVFVYAPGQINPSYDIPSGVALRTAGIRSLAARALWGQTVLPSLAARDEVEVFWGPAHRLPLTLAERIARVVTIHDLVWVHAPETMRARTRIGERLLMKPALRRADMVVTDSNATAAALETEFPWLRSPIRTVAPGATPLPAPGGFSGLQPLGITRPYALFVGTLEPRKNLGNLIRAYGLLPEGARSACDLVIVGGSGWKQTSLADEVRLGGLERNVNFTGFVDDGMLATLYANCLFLAMPSRYEGFGFPIVEAQSFGKPVLTSNISSMPEVAGDSAILVEPNDPTSIADAFGRLCGDAQLRQKIAAGARRNAERFTWENHARGMLGIFEQAAGQRRRTAA